jgi:hypothetical protein
MKEEVIMKGDALETIGNIIEGDEIRDAVHIACLPAEAEVDLYAGMHVGYKDGKASPMYDNIGIVDAFIKGIVPKGNHFWIMVYPRNITGLRPIWTHPNIPDNSDANKIDVSNRTEDEKYLRSVAEQIGVGYEKFMEDVESFVEYDETPITRGYEPENPNINDLGAFWNIWSRHTGGTIPKNAEDLYWSYSC